MIKRILEKTITKELFKKKIIIIYGARQVGKTTLAKEIIKNTKKKTKYIDCDLFENRQILSSQNLSKLKKFLSPHDLIVIDEAQRVKNIGLNLKIIHDHCPEIQIIATGSSSFDLANEINEPLTGRAFDYMLPPLSLEEIKQKLDNLELMENLENLLIFGSYPDIFDENRERAEKILNSIASNYLYKDILEFERLKKPDQLLNMLQLLALQIGGEVSFSEIGGKLGLNTVTVQKYINLLEKTFVIFSLGGFSRNLRKEIRRSPKIYFWDLGIRNSLIRNFNPLNLRSDIGSLWENFCIAERMKFNLNNQRFINTYFWRNYYGQEIDYIEERGGELNAFEFKWNENKKTKIPKMFSDTYPGSNFSFINKGNFDEFLCGK